MKQEIEERPSFVNREGIITDPSYVDWLKALKQRYRQTQLKAAVKVNSELLQFYWNLGKDIVSMKQEEKYGKYFFNQLSLDLGKIFNDVKGFSVSNLKYIVRWYAYYNRGQQVVDQKYIDSDFVNIPWGHHIAATVNSTLTMMYWHIGHRINQDVLDNQRAEYGKQIVAPGMR